MTIEQKIIELQRKQITSCSCNLVKDTYKYKVGLFSIFPEINSFGYFLYMDEIVENQEVKKILDHTQKDLVKSPFYFEPLFDYWNFIPKGIEGLNDGEDYCFVQFFFGDCDVCGNNPQPEEVIFKGFVSPPELQLRCKNNHVWKGVVFEDSKQFTWESVGSYNSLDNYKLKNLQSVKGLVSDKEDFIYYMRYPDRGEEVCFCPLCKPLEKLVLI